ncbi:MAG: aldehyde dehydrogenase family protein [Leucobacter sp.]
MSTLERIPVLNPADDAQIGEIEVQTPETLDGFVSRARAAFPAWAAIPAHERSRRLHEASRLIGEHQEELAELLVRENGKPWDQAFAEIGTASRLFASYGAEAVRQHGITIPGDAQPGTERDLIFTRREPRGVLGAIIAFNAPMDLFSHKTAAALASGNVVIIKPAEAAPLTVIRAAELIWEAGVPRDALQILTGRGRDVGAALAEHPGIDILSLTGSAAAGISVARSAAKRLTPVMLELGGNDPLIVRPDADLDLAIEQAVFGRTQANGQICCSNKRLIVQADVVDEFTRRLVERLAPIRIGDPNLDRSIGMGPLIHARAARTATEQVARAVEQGAEVIHGTGAADRNFFAPTVLANVAPGTDVATDMEIFASVFPVIRYETDAEAIGIANDTSFGLNASVFTNDARAAMFAAHHLQAGTVSINATGLYRPDAIAYGGRKLSGFGREGLEVSFEEMTHVKNIAFRGILPTQPPGFPDFEQ